MEVKEHFERKYNEFIRSGLKSYLEYLKKEQKNAANKSHKKAYLEYIEKEIKSAESKIEKLNEKLD